MLSPFLQGCGTGAGLIIAIGAQNAYLLRLGILRCHVLLAAFICFTIDAILIYLGIGGCGQFIANHEWLLWGAKWGGFAFLMYYGVRSLLSCFQTNVMEVEGGMRPSLGQILGTLFAVSLLNPHAYLDTMVLLGSIGAQFPQDERTLFCLGAIVASFLWFFSLTLGSRWLAPLFVRPIAWKILDGLTAVIMFGVAFSLLL